MATTAKQKQSARAKYTWYPGELTIRPDPERTGFQLPYDIVTEANLDRIIAELGQAQVSSLDTETTSLDHEVAKLCCISFHYGTTAYTAFLEHSVEEVVLSRPSFIRLCLAIAKVPAIVFFNFNYDFRILKTTLPEIDWRAVFIEERALDAQSLVYLSDTNIWDWSLKSASRKFLGVDPPEFDQDALGEAIFLKDPVELAFYASFDAWDTYELAMKFFPEMARNYGFIVKLDRKFMLPLIEFEDGIIPVNWDTMKAYGEQLTLKIEATKEQFFGKFGPMNMNSGLQKIALLKSLGFDTGEKTETGLMKVGIKQLEKLQDRSEAAALLITYSRLTKVYSSYVSPMLERYYSGRPIRFKYRSCRVPTYRLAAGSYAISRKKKFKNLGPWIAANPQSFPKPKMTERLCDFDPVTFDIIFHPQGKYLVETSVKDLTFRRAFEVAEDEVWVATDFSGQEIVVAANESGDEVMLAALREGRDLHKEMAIRIWGEENYDKNKRKMAKSAVFGVMYGGTEWTLMQNLGITEEVATFVVSQMKKALPKLFLWIEGQHMKARRSGSIHNAFGLPRRLRPYYLMGGSWRGYADRSSVNTAIQSCGSVMIRLALIKIWMLINNKYGGTVEVTKMDGEKVIITSLAMFLATIHDEVNFRVKKSHLLQFLGDLDDVLLSCNHPKWSVKAGVEHSIGPNWAEVIPMKLTKDASGRVVSIEPKGEVIDHSIKVAQIEGTVGVAGDVEEFFDADYEEDEEYE